MLTGLLVAGVPAMQAAAASAARVISMQAFAQEQGLRSLAANVLLRDRQGVLWVGTDKGLYRFDGRGFVQAEGVDAGSLRVNDLYQAPDGRLWIGASQGLYVWRDGSAHAMAAVAVDDLRRIAGDGADGVYVRHQHRLVHVDAQGAMRDVPWPQALSVGALTDGAVMWFRGRLWTTCAAQLCTRSADGEREVWGVQRGVPEDSWITFHRDASGALWVGGAHHLLQLPPGGDRFRAVDSDDPVEAIDTDGQGRVLAGTAGHISRWDGTQWQAFQDDRGLQFAQIRDVLFEASGTVWLATGGRGVLRWRGYDRFRNWLAAQGLDSAPTWAIARDADGRLWLGNQRNGNLLEPGATHLAPWPKALRRHAWVDAVALLPHGRSMWIVFNHGTVVRYALDSGRAQQVVDDAGWAKFGLIDAHGRLWFGTHGSLWRIDDTDAAQPHARRMATGLPADTNYLGAGVGAGNRLWFATSHGLLGFADGRFGRAAVSGAPAGGFAGVTRAPDGRLWLAGVNGGLFWTREKASGVLSLHAVNDALLQRTLIYSLAVDRSGHLWVSSEAGIDRYDGKHWRRYDRSDGLVWDDMSAGAFHQDPDGSIWFGTSGGVSHLLHPERSDVPVLPAPAILGVSYGGQAWRPDRGGALRWNRKALTVSLASLGDAHADSAEIEYRLLDDGEQRSAWETSTSRILRFATLEPGSYRFQARVVDPDLRARSPMASFRVEIVPPWWRSVWARTLYVLLGMLAVALLWRLRSARLLRRQLRLEKMVADRTRELEEDKRALEAARKALQYEASHDALTGLLNRGAIVDALQQALRDVRQAPPHPLAVVLIDLDHFKQVNDTHGHLAGDAVLTQCAQSLRELVPAHAALGRYGGEEMLVVWPGLDRDGDVQTLFAPLIAAEYVDGEVRLRVTCSIGVAWARHDDDAGTLLRRADAALYRAKAAGRARVERADPPAAPLSTR